MTTELAVLSGNAGAGSALISSEQFSQVVKFLASGRVDFAAVTQAELERLAVDFMEAAKRDTFNRKVMAARVDLPSEIDAFLARYESKHTRRSYRKALADFSEWLAFKGLSVAELTPAGADDYMLALRASGKDADSTRQRIAVVSSFLSFMERRLDGFKNPMRGSRARPKPTWKTAQIPSAAEMDAILAGCQDPLLRLAVLFMAQMGFRIGGLAEVEILKDRRARTITKGCTFTTPDPLPASIEAALAESGLDQRHPFGKYASENITTLLTMRFNRLIARLHSAGTISARFSPHDLRHFFTEQNQEEGIVSLQRKLGHSTIGITQHYLRNQFSAE